MAHAGKNYKTDNGNTTVIGGTLIVEEGATVTGLADAAALVAATETTFGAVKAAEAGAGETVPGKIKSDGKLYVPTYPAAATAEAAGLVLQAANVAAIAEPEAGSVGETVNAILSALKAAGIMVDDV